MMEVAAKMGWAGAVVGAAAVAGAGGWRYRGGCSPQGAAGGGRVWASSRDGSKEALGALWAPEQQLAQGEQAAPPLAEWSLLQGDWLLHLLLWAPVVRAALDCPHALQQLLCLLPSTTLTPAAAAAV